MLGNYSLPDVLERIYDNQLALEAAVMELMLWVVRMRWDGMSVELWKQLVKLPAISNTESGTVEGNGGWLADDTPKAVSGRHSKLPANLSFLPTCAKNGADT